MSNTFLNFKCPAHMRESGSKVVLQYEAFYELSVLFQSYQVCSFLYVYSL